MAYVPNSNSVVAFQSDPTKLVGTFSVVGNMNSSITAYQGGAWSTSITGGYSNVIGSVLVTGSVAAYQGTNPWIMNVPTPSYISYQAAGSIMAVSGSFSASPQSSINALQLAGSILAVNVPTPSYISYQLAGSVMAVAATVNTGNSSVQLLNGVAAIGSVAVLQGTNPWQVNMPSPSVIAYQLAGSVMAVAATVNTGNSSVQLLQGVAAIGSVAVLQGTNPWQVNMPSPSVVVIHPAGSVVQVRTDNASVVAVLSNSSVTTLQGTNPWVVNVPTPSYISYQLAGSIMAVSATVNTGNSSVQLVAGTATIGSVTALQGTNPYVMTGSVQGTMSVLGTVPVTQSTSPWVVNVPTPSYIAYQLAGSIMAVAATVNTGNSSVQLLSGVAVIGSVATLQGTNPWIINMPSPSVIAYQLAGSVMAVNTTVTTGPSSVQLLSTSASIAVLVNNMLTGVSSVQLMSTSASIVTTQNYGYSSVMLMASTNASVAVLASQNTNPWVIGSIVGTYAEDSAHTSGDKGIFSLHVRNDTMSSITSNDTDYSPFAVGPVGELLTANAPITKWVQGIGSVFGGTSVQVLAAQGSSVFTYITGIQVMNASANNVFLTFTGGLGLISSVLGYTSAPANGGSNIILPNAWKTGANSGFSASVSGVASIYLAVEGFISKT